MGAGAPASDHPPASVSLPMPLGGGPAKRPPGTGGGGLAAALISRRSLLICGAVLFGLCLALLTALPAVTTLRAAVPGSESESGSGSGPSPRARRDELASARPGPGTGVAAATAPPAAAMIVPGSPAAEGSHLLAGATPLPAGGTAGAVIIAAPAVAVAPAVNVTGAQLEAAAALASDPAPPASAETCTLEGFEDFEGSYMGDVSGLHAAPSAPPLSTPLDRRAALRPAGAPSLRPSARPAAISAFSWGAVPLAPSDSDAGAEFTEAKGPAPGPPRANVQPPLPSYDWNVQHAAGLYPGPWAQARAEANAWRRRAAAAEAAAARRPIAILRNLGGQLSTAFRLGRSAASTNASADVPPKGAGREPVPPGEIEGGAGPAQLAPAAPWGLDPAATAIEPGDVDAADAGGSIAGGFRVQILNGQGYIVHERPGWDSRHRSMKLFLFLLLSTHVIPDVDFYWSSTDRPLSNKATFNYCCYEAVPPTTPAPPAPEIDAPPTGPEAGLPGAGAGGGPEDVAPRPAPGPPGGPRCAVLPDFTILSWPEVRDDSYPQTMESVRSAAATRPYAEREPRLFWRGAGNSPVRDAFAGLSVQQPTLMDVKVMRWSDLTAEAAAATAAAKKAAEEKAAADAAAAAAAAGTSPTPDAAAAAPPGACAPAAVAPAAPATAEPPAAAPPPALSRVQTFKVLKGNEDYATLEDNCRHRFLLHIEGVGYSARLKYLFACNSTVFIVEGAPSCQEWWQPLLRPMVHYIPVRKDLSDAAERVQWALDHPAEAQAIGARGAELVARVVTERNALCYAARALGAYAAAQKAPPLARSGDAVELTRSLFYPPG